MSANVQINILNLFSEMCCNTCLKYKYFRPSVNVPASQDLLDCNDKAGIHKKKRKWWVLVVLLEQLGTTVIFCLVFIESDCKQRRSRHIFLMLWGKYLLSQRIAFNWWMCFMNGWVTRGWQQNYTSERSLYFFICLEMVLIPLVF